MRILITGSSGLVGSACVDFFTKKGWEITGIDNNMRSYFFNTPEKNTGENVDIRNESHINMVFQQDGPFDAIIHAAAQPSHDWASQEPLTDFDVNARGTLVLLEATRKYSSSAVFVHVSTDKVYGENMVTFLEEGKSRYTPGVPLEIQGEAGPIFGFNEYLGLDFAGQRSLFGCSKAAADMYAQEYANYFGLKVGIFRPGCITGKAHEGAEQHGFLAYLAKCIKEGKTYKIFGYKGKQVRDQIHANDLANAFYHFIQNPKVGGVYNIGGGPDHSVSVLEAGELISKEVGKPFLFELHEGRKGDRQWDVHDVSKFKKDYPEWNYEYSLQDIIKDVCEKAL